MHSNQLRKVAARASHNECSHLVYTNCVVSMTVIVPVENYADFVLYMYVFFRSIQFCYGNCPWAVAMYISLEVC